MMQANTSPYIYTDLSGLGHLKNTARENQQAAIMEIAKQFESLFTHMMLKSMRDASFGDPIFDSNQSMAYRDMFDNQLALSMSKGRGLGLAETLARQLQQQITISSPADVPQAVSVSKPVVIEPVTETVSPASPAQRPHVMTDPDIQASTAPVVEVVYAEEKFDLFEPEEYALPVDEIVDDEPVHAVPLTFQAQSKLSRQEQFVQQLWPQALKAADELNVDAEVLIAQAALETGWGRHVTRAEDGRSSYNLFNIKAGSDWEGKTVDKLTLEYHGGVPVWEKATFRAYDSYEESFRDYADFLQSRERYQQALEESANPVRYIQGLQRAGYATDPNYADKVINIMNREWDVFDKYSSLYAEGQYDV